MIQHNTKIVVTVGPSCNSYEALRDLALLGVSVFRLNFSHGSHNDHESVINHIVSINEHYGLHLGILADLQGPKLRIGSIENNVLLVNEGDILTFKDEECLGNNDQIYMSYDRFAQDVKIGERILIDDGKLVFEVVESNGKDTTPRGSGPVCL